MNIAKYQLQSLVSYNIALVASVVHVHALIDSYTLATHIEKLHSLARTHLIHRVCNLVQLVSRLFEASHSGDRSLCHHTWTRQDESRQQLVIVAEVQLFAIVTWKWQNPLIVTKLISLFYWMSCTYLWYEYVQIKTIFVFSNVYIVDASFETLISLWTRDSVSGGIKIGRPMWDRLRILYIQRTNTMYLWMGVSRHLSVKLSIVLERPNNSSIHGKGTRS